VICSVEYSRLHLVAAVFWLAAELIWAAVCVADGLQHELTVALSQ